MHLAYLEKNTSKINITDKDEYNNFHEEQKQYLEQQLYVSQITSLNYSVCT